jgi:hypothetical protein
MNALTVLLLVIGAGGQDKAATRIDFEDAEVGKLPEGWTADKTDLTGKAEGSVWNTIEDKTAPKGPKVLAQTSSAGPGAVFNLCIAAKPLVKDVDLSVAFKAVSGKKDQGGGPIWRCKDANNYYVARMNPLEDNFRLYKVVDGKRIQLATAEEVVAKDRAWHTIRVVHVGSQIRCYFNGKKLLEAKDDTFADAGKIGLWTKADAVTSFDDIVLTTPGKD